MMRKRCFFTSMSTWPAGTPSPAATTLRSGQGARFDQHSHPLSWIWMSTFMFQFYICNGIAFNYYTTTSTIAIGIQTDQ